MLRLRRKKNEPSLVETGPSQEDSDGSIARSGFEPLISALRGQRPGPARRTGLGASVATPIIGRRKFSTGGFARDLRSDRRQLRDEHPPGRQLSGGSRRRDRGHGQ